MTSGDKTRGCGVTPRGRSSQGCPAGSPPPGQASTPPSSGQGAAAPAAYGGRRPREAAPRRPARSPFFSPPLPINPLCTSSSRSTCGSASPPPPPPSRPSAATGTGEIKPGCVWGGGERERTKQARSQIRCLFFFLFFPFSPQRSRPSAAAVGTPPGCSWVWGGATGGTGRGSQPLSASECGRIGARRRIQIRRLGIGRRRGFWGGGKKWGGGDGDAFPLAPGDPGPPPAPPHARSSAGWKPKQRGGGGVGGDRGRRGGGATLSRF